MKGRDRNGEGGTKEDEVTVKFALQQAMKAKRRSRGIALLFL
jgi:hypothetical protein